MKHHHVPDWSITYNAYSTDLLGWLLRLASSLCVTSIFNQLRINREVICDICLGLKSVDDRKVYYRTTTRHYLHRVSAPIWEVYGLHRASICAIQPISGCVTCRRPHKVFDLFIENRQPWNDDESTIVTISQIILLYSTLHYSTLRTAVGKDCLLRGIVTVLRRNIIYYHTNISRNLWYTQCQSHVRIINSSRWSISV